MIMRKVCLVQQYIYYCRNMTFIISYLHLPFPCLSIYTSPLLPSSRSPASSPSHYSSLEPILCRPVHDDIICPCRVVVQIDAVSYVRLDVCLPRLGIREALPCCTLGAEKPNTVTTAKDQVLLSGEVEDGPSKTGSTKVEGRRANELTNCEGEFCAFGVGEDGGVEEGVLEEGVLVIVFIAPSQKSSTVASKSLWLVFRREMEGVVCDEFGCVCRYGGESS